MSRNTRDDDNSRELVRAVTRTVVNRIGNAGPAVVEAVVAEVLAAMGPSSGGGGSGGGGGRTSYVNPGSSATFTTPRGSQLLPVMGQGAPALETCLSCVADEKQRKRNRAVLTTTGRNTKGIVARATTRIAELGGDILDISQTLVSDFFTMIIVIDVGSLSVPFDRFQDEVVKSVRELGCQAMLMHDDVLTSLHRV